MARSYTITQDGESRSYTIEDGIGPSGSDANVTNANVNSAIEDDPSATRLALEIPIDNFVATTAPTNNDDSGDGYSVGSKWYDSVGQEAYLCVDSTLGSAVWILTTLTADDLGTAAFTDSTDYATAAQGALADTAVQPAEFSSPPPIGDLTPNSGDFTTLSATGTATLPHIHGSIAGNLYIHVRNDTGGTLTRGTPIYIVGNVGDTDRVQVAAADNTNSAKMPAVGLLEESLDNNGDGNAIIVGELPLANTNAYSINQELYVGVGALTGTKPTTGEVQSVGAVARVNTNTGVIVVNMQGRRTPDEAFATAAQGTDERVPTAAGLTSKFSTNKATIVDGDKVAIFDSAASDTPKHTLWSLIVSTLTTAFNALYVGLTGNQTIAGNKTFSGQTELTGQAATNSTSVLTRGLLLAELSQNLFEPLSFNAPTKSGTTFTTQVAYGGANFYLQVSNAATSGAFARVESSQEYWNKIGSGAAMEFASGELSIVFDLYVNTFSENEIRVLWGVSTGKNVLDVAGWGLVFESATSCKLQVHNGSTLSESSAITLNASLGLINYSRFMLTANNGVLTLYQRSTGIGGSLGRWVNLGTITGSSLGTYSSGTSLSFINIADGTMVGPSNLVVKNPTFYHGVVTP